MLLALLTTFAASRKEPLVEVLERIRAALVAANWGEPHVDFTMADSPVGGGVSSVARVLKRFPQLERFAQEVSPSPGAPNAVRVLSNRAPNAGVESEAVDFSTLLEIARGVPRSFPFHTIGIHFSVAAFSAGTTLPPMQGVRAPGISVNDSWWVNGRNRSVSALTFVEADAAAKKLPKLPDGVAAVLAACGKVKKTMQAPVAPGPVAAPKQRSMDSASSEKAKAIRAVVQSYRTRIAEIAERAGLPHDLPPNQEAVAVTPPGLTPGPKKPELVRAFTPMGYDCRGETGTFTLRRRTPENLTVELSIDVGTWSNSVAAIHQVQGLVEGIGFKASVIVPVARRAAAGGQYPIGGAEQWRKIVDNMAAMVAELDRTFVPEVEAIAGPAPEWYQPESSKG